MVPRLRFRSRRVPGGILSPRLPMPLETRVTTTEGKIGGRLKEFGKTPECTSSWPELDPETENLVRKNPFAFLVAVAFD